MDQLANLIAIAFTVQFFVSYYRNCYRKGYTIDVWHFLLVFNLFAIHIMLPFSRSDLNVFALGPTLLRRAQAHIDEAYFISTAGYAGILIGGTLWRFNLGLGLRKRFARLIEPLSEGSLLLLRSRGLLVLHGVVAIAMLAGVVLYYFRVEGFGFSVRGLLLVRPDLRPIAQFAAFYSVLVASYSLVRFYLYKELSSLLVVSLLIFGLLFFGERSNLAAIAIILVIGIFIRLGRKLRLFSLAVGSFVALCITFILDGLRSPNFSIKAVMEGFALSIFYGNSFSDTRDFATILSFWDGHFIWGKTYLAGLIAFIPRVLSSFRDKWSYGVVTATMAGLDPTEHPGLRIGSFGEAYLNFGLVGVILLGLFVGAITRLIDLRMKQSAASSSTSGIRLFSYYILTLYIAVAENSSTASTFYTTVVIIGLSWAALRIATFLQIQL